MAFQFPPSPSVNQTFTPVAGVTYRWSGTAWHLIAGPGAFITQADADTRYVNVDEAQNTTNRIINGKFAIDQRNAGASALISTGAVQYAQDRWYGLAAGGGTFFMQRIPGIPLVGDNTLQITVGTVDATLASGDAYFINQSIEGINVADLSLGSAAAKSFTFACEISSTVSGTFPLAFRNNAANRSYVTTVSLTAGVPAPVLVIVPGDTSGTWDYGTNAGLHVSIGIGMGSALNATPNTWQAGNFLSVAGCVNLMATAGALLRLSNVRLYKGSVDFGPDRRLYAEELALCQRYFQQVNAGVPGSGSMFRGPIVGSNFFWMPFSVQMRAVPTMSIGTPVYGSASGAAMGNVQPSGAEVSFTTAVQNGNVIIPWTASAEL